jgi:hypothetical protein
VPQFDELSAITQFELYPRALRDLVFKGAPFWAYLRKQGAQPFAGGNGMRSSFLYGVMNGGFYSQGENFNLLKNPVLAATQFKPRYIYVAIPEYKEILQVENTGPLALISLLDADMRAAVNTINAMLAIAIWREGQSAARIKAINGLSECFNNGTDPSWDGTIATTYGGETRSAVNGVLNSAPMWLGDSAGNAGSIQYHHLLESHQDASRGPDEPKLGVVNKAGFAYCLERMQTQQRFMENLERDPIWGATGFRFMSARIIKDEYAPSLVYGENHPILGSNLTGTFTTPASPTAKSLLPGATLVTVGEVFAWINPEAFTLRISTDEEFAFGFSGFIPSQRNTRVVGHIKAGLNVQGHAPHLGKFLYGFSS